MIGLSLDLESSGSSAANARLPKRGLVQYQRSDKGLTTGVWSDQSGSAHDLTAVTAGTLVTGSNGRPALRLAGAATNQQYKTATYTLNQPSTVLVVAQMLTLSGTAGVNDILWDGFGNGSMVGGSITTTTTGISAGVAISSATPVGAGVFSLLAEYNGASGRLEMNGTQLVAGDVGANNGAGFTLGALGGAGRSVNADVFMVAVWNVILTANELKQARKFAKAWGRF